MVNEDGKTNVNNSPSRGRWQVLLIEYELLDAYWSQLQQRVWMSGLVLVSLSMVGIVFLLTVMDPTRPQTTNSVGLIAIVASLLAIGWWLLLRRMFSGQQIAEIRRNEIEKELGMRSSLYLTFLRQNQKSSPRKSSNLARKIADGDDELEIDLVNLSTNPESFSWLPGFISDRWVWSAIPWLLIASWIALYVIKSSI
jgi:high-affinity Fe2+/Pb2+ permease